ncbi:MAG TPA: hypothetical protein VFX84_00045 [Candidatus Saccharimonadales bacterium]|nr:hypothetical protein [Candidatus Saccharimonadales bacterium]
MAKKSKRKGADKLLTSVGLIVTVVLLLFGGLALWAYTFTATNVHNQLAAQNIYFPEKGSKSLEDPQIKPYLEQYAGQQLLTGPQAKAYANHYIAVHLQKVAGGQTYAEVSSKAQKDPGNAQLQQQANTLFKGETLRGLLLGNAYAFSVIGQIALIAAIVCFSAAALMTIFVLLGIWHLSTLR